MSINLVAKPEDRGNLIRQALRSLRAGWQSIAGASYDAAAASMRPDLPGDDLEPLRQQMRACLEGRGGEVSARARAAALGRAYLALDPTGRERFLRVLAVDFDISEAELSAAIDALKAAQSPEDRNRARQHLRVALDPPRIKLLTQFNSLPQGIKFLVNMRAELLPLGRKDPALALLADDLRVLLATWFDVDFLELRRITWDTASGALLEKLIAYEAVHPIESWDDLKDRLDYDRRYFAYFHPRMPDEPLIFVEVALVNGIADNVQNLLDPSAPPQDPTTADTAIFYSISNAQRGLDGISFGNFLIKRVVGELSHEFPNIKTFATLSPIPGFVRWLDLALAEGRPGLLKPADRKTLATLGITKGAKGWLRQTLAGSDWHDNEALLKTLRPLLFRLCAQYLAREQRSGGTALDPVAHFHLSNGAVMDRLNWMADRSKRGLRHSAGLMINYRYDLAKIEENHEFYRSGGKRALSPAIRGLLSG
ncbi:MAG: malonyl-CoA decarboxylase [Defluviicoccus sp.]|nr:malonyl-CoA decarboxylase [Defluviicoccus sp.]